MTNQEMQLETLKAIVISVAARAGYQDADVADEIIAKFKELTGESTFESTIEVNDD